MMLAYLVVILMELYSAVRCVAIKRTPIETRLTARPGATQRLSHRISQRLSAGLTEVGTRWLKPMDNRPVNGGDKARTKSREVRGKKEVSHAADRSQWINQGKALSIKSH